MFGNNRKGDKLMKFARAPGEPVSLAVLLLGFFFVLFLTTSSFPVWSSSPWTLVVASDLYSQAAPGTWRRAGCSRRSGQGEPRTLLVRQSQGQKSRTFGTEAGVQTESVLAPGRVRQRQVITPLYVPASSSVTRGQ